MDFDKKNLNEAATTANSTEDKMDRLKRYDEYWDFERNYHFNSEIDANIRKINSAYGMDNAQKAKLMRSVIDRICGKAAGYIGLSWEMIGDDKYLFGFYESGGSSKHMNILIPYDFKFSALRKKLLDWFLKKKESETAVTDGKKPSIKIVESFGRGSRGKDGEEAAQGTDIIRNDAAGKVLDAKFITLFDQYAKLKRVNKYINVATLEIRTIRLRKKLSQIIGKDFDNIRQTFTKAHLFFSGSIPVTDDVTGTPLYWHSLTNTQKLEFVTALEDEYGFEFTSLDESFARGSRSKSGATASDVRIPVRFGSSKQEFVENFADFLQGLTGFKITKNSRSDGFQIVTDRLGGVTVVAMKDTQNTKDTANFCFEVRWGLDDGDTTNPDGKVCAHCTWTARVPENGTMVRAIQCHSWEDDYWGKYITSAFYKQTFPQEKLGKVIDTVIPIFELMKKGDRFFDIMKEDLSNPDENTAPLKKYVTKTRTDFATGRIDESFGRGSRGKNGSEAGDTDFVMERQDLTTRIINTLTVNGCQDDEEGSAQIYNPKGNYRVIRNEGHDFIFWTTRKMFICKDGSPMKLATTMAFRMNGDDTFNIFAYVGDGPKVEKRKFFSYDFKTHTPIVQELDLTFRPLIAKRLREGYGELSARNTAGNIAVLDSILAEVSPYLYSEVLDAADGDVYGDLLERFRTFLDEKLHAVAAKYKALDESFGRGARGKKGTDVTDQASFKIEFESRELGMWIAEALGLEYPFEPSELSKVKRFPGEEIERIHRDNCAGWRASDGTHDWLRDFVDSDAVVPFNEFRYFTGIESLAGSDTLSSAGEDSFIPMGMLVHLSELTLPDSMRRIKAWALYKTNPVEFKLTLNEGLEEICNEGLAGCAGLTSVTLPSTVRRIGEKAFSLNSALTEVVLNEGLEEIGYLAFDKCRKLGRVAIPSTVRRIGGILSTDSSLEIILNDNDNFTIEDGMFTSRDGTLISYNKTDTADGTVVIPEGITALAKGAFASFDSSVEIIMPKSLRRIDGALQTLTFYSPKMDITLNSDLEEIGPNAFNCNVRGLRLTESLRRIGEEAFGNCVLRDKDGEEIGVLDFTKATNLEEVGKGAFRNTIGFSEVLFPEKVKFTELKSTFSGTQSLRSVNRIPYGVKVLDSTFSYCENLVKIGETSLPDTIETVLSPFSGANKLETVFRYATIPSNWKATDTLSHFEFDRVEAVPDSNGVATITGLGTYERHGRVMESNIRSAKVDTLSFGEGVRTIPSSRFVCDRNIKRIIMPTTLELVETSSLPTSNFTTSPTRIYIPELRKAVTFKKDFATSWGGATIYCSAKDYSKFMTLKKFENLRHRNVIHCYDTETENIALPWRKEDCKEGSLGSVNYRLEFYDRHAISDIPQARDNLTRMRNGARPSELPDCVSIDGYEENTDVCLTTFLGEPDTMARQTLTIDFRSKLNATEIEPKAVKATIEKFLSGRKPERVSKIYGKEVRIKIRLKPYYHDEDEMVFGAEVSLVDPTDGNKVAINPSTGKKAQVRNLLVLRFKTDSEDHYWRPKRDDELETILKKKSRELEKYIVKSDKKYDEMYRKQEKEQEKERKRRERIEKECERKRVNQKKKEILKRMKEMEAEGNTTEVSEKRFDFDSKP